MAMSAPILTRDDRADPCIIFGSNQIGRAERHLVARPAPFLPLAVALGRRFRGDEVATPLLTNGDVQKVSRTSPSGRSIRQADGRV
ncbi:hypothetical protein D3C72_2005100 [compost metagenome]